MIRFTKRLFAYLTTAIAAYAIAVLVVGLAGIENKIPGVLNLTGDYGHSLERFREAENYGPVDMVFVGSSHTYRGFDPRIFAEAGITSFNLGSSSQTPLNSYYLLQNYLDQLQPKTVVMEVYWGIFESKDGSEASIDIACNTPASANMLCMAASSYDVLTYNSTLVSYAKRLRTPLNDAVQKPMAGDTYISGGYVQSSDVVDVTAEVEKLKSYTAHLAQIQLDYLQQSIAMCKEKGIEVVLVRTPVTAKYFELLINYKEVTDPIRAIAQQNDIRFHDFNDRNTELNLKTDFLDKNHLSHAGVVRFNEWFIDWMENK